MEKFIELLKVAETLLGPRGCPWDQKQTFRSLQPYVLEEAHEVIEAVDLDDDNKIIEELGDLLYTIIFYGKLAEKMKRFSVEEIVSCIKEKLIRRHPHIFGDIKVKNMEEIFSNWETIKKQEKNSKSSDIPPTLPGLIRGQKVLKKMNRAGFPSLKEENKEKISEDDFGKKLLLLLVQANENEIDAESALRRALNELSERFQQWETQPK